MSEAITSEAVSHVAKLARLKLSEAEVAQFTEQLGRVLDYASKLQKLDLDDVEPMAHPTDMSNKLRDDEPGPVLDNESALSNAPQRDGPFFRVPKVFDESSA